MDDQRRQQYSKAKLDGHKARTIGWPITRNPHKGHDEFSRVLHEAWADAWIDCKPNKTQGEEDAD